MKSNKKPNPARSTNKNALAKTNNNLIPENLARTIDALPEEQKLAVLQSFGISAQTFSGPIPSPEHFKQYEQILPGTANRILSMAEKEQQIRENLNTGMLGNDRRLINATTIVGSLLGLGLLLVAALATYLGNTAIAIPLGLGGVIVTILRYLLNWYNSRKVAKQETS